MWRPFKQRNTIYIPPPQHDFNRYDTIWTCAMICSQVKIERIVEVDATRLIEDADSLVRDRRGDTRNNWVIKSPGCTPGSYNDWKTDRTGGRLGRALQYARSRSAFARDMQSTTADAAERFPRLRYLKRKDVNGFGRLCSSAGLYTHNVGHEKHLFFIDKTLIAQFNAAPLRVAQKLAAHISEWAQAVSILDVAISDIQNAAFVLRIKSPYNRAPAMLLWCAHLDEYDDDVMLEAACAHARGANIDASPVSALIEFVCTAVRRNNAQYISLHSSIDTRHYELLKTNSFVCEHHLF